MTADLAAALRAVVALVDAVDVNSPPSTTRTRELETLARDVRAVAYNALWASDERGCKS